MHKGKIWQNCMQSFHRFIDLNVSVSSVASTFLSRTLFMWFRNVSHMFFTFQGRWCGTAAQRCLCRATPSPTAYCHWHHSWLWERRQRWRHCHWWQRVVAKVGALQHLSRVSTYFHKHTSGHKFALFECCHLPSLETLLLTFDIGISGIARDVFNSEARRALTSKKGIPENTFAPFAGFANQQHIECIKQAFTRDRIRTIIGTFFDAGFVGKLSATNEFQKQKQMQSWHSATVWNASSS